MSLITIAPENKIMNIPFAGSLTKEEFKDIVKLGQRPVSKKSTTFIEVWVIFLLLGLGIIAVGLRMLFTTENINGGIMVMAVGAVFLILGMKFQKAIDQAWEEYKKTDLGSEGNITDEYLETRNSMSHSQVLWNGFSGYGEYRNVLVLFQGQVGCPFSARFFQTETDWQEFKKFVSSKLPISHKVQSSLNLSPNWFTWLLIILSVIGLIIYLDSK